MRQLVLDTETTGLDPDLDHRIIEIGCVELVNRRFTRNNFQQYLNPGREIDEAALEVHGITVESLADKPHFEDIVDDFLAYVDGAELIIHNAPFDTAFLDYELSQLLPKRGCIEDYCTVLDSLVLARDLHPGQRNSLDALCKRYGIDNSQRTLHGALLDAEILADVYLSMTGGQAALLLDGRDFKELDAVQRERSLRRDNRAPLPVIVPTSEELAAHNAWLDYLDQQSAGQCLWRRLQRETDCTS
ncbi:MAG: DNA polymerase III subunit epsilon [Gammaproteobacteria bacterium]|nr:DNA polymerase III subunit epsilon [Gammaproteobacteria bacterium]